MVVSPIMLEADLTKVATLGPEANTLLADLVSKEGRLLVDTCMWHSGFEIQINSGRLVITQY